MAAGGPDVLFGHGANGGQVLVLDRFRGAAAFAHVAGEAAGVAGLVFEVDVDAGVEQVAEIVPVEGEEALDDDDIAGLDVLGAGDAGVAGEIVVGNVDGLATGEGGALGEQEGVIKRGRFVEVRFGAGFEGEVGEVPVVAVEGDDGGSGGGGEPAREFALARTGGAGDANDAGRHGLLGLRQDADALGGVPSPEFDLEAAGVDGGVGIAPFAGFVDAGGIEDEDAGGVPGIGKRTGKDEFSFLGESSDVVHVAFEKFFGLRGDLFGPFWPLLQNGHDVEAHGDVLGAEGQGKDKEKEEPHIGVSIAILAQSLRRDTDMV